METIKLKFGKTIETATHKFRAGNVVEFRSDDTKKVDDLIEQGAEVVFDYPKPEPELLAEPEPVAESIEAPKPKRRRKRKTSTPKE